MHPAWLALPLSEPHHLTRLQEDVREVRANFFFCCQPIDVVIFTLQIMHPAELPPLLAVQRRKVKKKVGYSPHHTAEIKKIIYFMVIVYISKMYRSCIQQSSHSCWQSEEERFKKVFFTSHRSNKKNIFIVIVYISIIYRSCIKQRSRG